ncbi:hypothetical protein [Polyangium jinanense]|uniref:Cytochrome c-552/4 domain-containing protein n=1 Tax=Polyangium jinanense TaxID=2829994 RepID=A0A9X3X2F9_9BACT|nr:hypothetical protein [Polyangium jinanense]MDC3956203.1 hypothetical protein [Polyangium jinanense]MDC3982962.1 hypothetical protein [Polyangium jinanense]
MNATNTRYALRAGVLLLLLPLGFSCGETPPGGGTTPGPEPEPEVELPPPLDPLPPVVLTTTDRFATSSQCGQCHFAGPETTVMHDAAGNDISPVYLWRSSMMGFAARDPYYLAVFGEELVKHSGREAFVEETCTRCHAPAGSEEQAQAGGHLTFDALVAGDGKEANLARDGVTCTLCHQIADDGLGKTQSFGGGFVIGYEREIYGPHLVPKVDPMQLIVNYTPTASAHITKSEVCATCHTVLVPIMKGDQRVGDFLEQAPYLEWKNSTFAEGVPCATCHLPTQDGAKVDISSPIAKFPAGLGARTPYGQHRFSGGNAYMLRILADNAEWTGAGVAPEELEQSAARAEAHVAEGAVVSILSASMQGSALAVEVQVENHAGHKFPTGYPSRRAWIHLRAEGAGGEVLFESGGFDATGALVDRAGARLDRSDSVLPHHDVVTKESEVQVYEAIAKDATGAPTHRPLASVGFVKDNRLLPLGWSSADPWIDWIGPVGVTGDGTFQPGFDRVTYKIEGGAAIRRVTVEVLYQSVRPTELDTLARVPHPAAVRFSSMASARPSIPLVAAQALIEL